MILYQYFQSYNKLYVYIVEEKLAESLTSFKHVQDQEFIRRNSTKYVYVCMCMCILCVY